MNRPQSTYQYEHDSCYDPLYDKKDGRGIVGRGPHVYQFLIGSSLICIYLRTVYYFISN